MKPAGFIWKLLSSKTFESGISGLSGRWCPSGASIRFCFRLSSVPGKIFPHLCDSSPHPLRGSSPFEGSLSEVVKRHWSRECFVSQSHMCFQPGRASELDSPPVLYGNFYLRKLLNRGYRGTRGYRDDREGGALRAQVLDFAFGSHLCREKFSSLVQVVPSPASRELPYRGEPFRGCEEALVPGVFRQSVSYVLSAGSGIRIG